MGFSMEIIELRLRLYIIEKAERGIITEDEALKQINERAENWGK